jgi:hypothetical protein
VVRQRMRIGFSGEPYPQSFALADVSMEWALPRDEVNPRLSGVLRLRQCHAGGTAHCFAVAVMSVSSTAVAEAAGCAV